MGGGRGGGGGVGMFGMLKTGPGTARKAYIKPGSFFLTIQYLGSSIIRIESWGS